MTAKLVTINAPTGGLNNYSPLAAMPADDAIELENMIPSARGCVVRNGFEYRAEVPYGCQGIFSFSDVSGVPHLVACSLDEVASISGGATTIIGTTYSPQCTKPCSAVSFRNRLFCVSDGCTPWDWGGSGSITLTAWTGPASINNLFSVASFRSRLYFIESGTGDLWYGGVDSISGALTSFPLSSLWNRGGYAIAMASLTKGGQYGLEDYFAILSSEGELLIYSGDYPGSASWATIGHFFTSKPLLPRPFFYVENDLYIASEDGIISVIEMMQARGADVRRAVKSIKIDKEIQEVIKLQSTQTTWLQCYLPKENLLLVSGYVYHRTRTPSGPSHYITTITRSQKIFACDLLTGGWCTLKCSLLDQGLCGMVVSSGSLYVATTTALFRYSSTRWNDVAMSSSAQTFDILCRHAPRRFADHKRSHFQQVKPYLVTSAQLTLSIGMEMDFEDRSVPGVVINPSNGVFGGQIGLRGAGTFGNLRIEGAVGSCVEYLAADIMFSEGGVL